MEAAAIKSLLGLVSRHLLTAGGAWLVTKGYADESTVTQVIGAVGTLAGLGWSIFQKHNSGVLGTKE